MVFRNAGVWMWLECLVGLRLWVMVGGGGVGVGVGFEVACDWLRLLVLRGRECNRVGGLN